MEARQEKSLMVFVLTLILLMILVPPFISISRGEEEKASYGVSVSGGFSEQSRGHRFTRWAFLPRVDLPLYRYWDLEFEGNFSYYETSAVKDLYVLGLNVNILFKPIRWDRNALFLLAGAGLGYNNSTERDHEAWDIGDTHVAGTVQGGFGIEYFIGRGCWLRGEYRFNHISDPFNADPGINSHNLMLGVSF
jgi:hypothetical protein